MAYYHNHDCQINGTNLNYLRFLPHHPAGQLLLLLWPAKQKNNVWQVL